MKPGLPIPPDFTGRCASQKSSILRADQMTRNAPTTWSYPAKQFRTPVPAEKVIAVAIIVFVAILLLAPVF
jgi:hypothetical protein